MRTGPTSTAIVLFAVFVLTLGNTIIHATLGLFGRGIGLGEFQMGTIVASSGLLFAVTSSRWGRIADRRGRRPVILWGLLGAAVSLALFGWLFTLQRGQTDLLTAFLALLAARMVYGFLCGGVQPAAVAFMADVTDGRDRSAGVALVGAAFGLATMVGPVLVGLLVGDGFAVAPFAACALTVLAAVAVLASMREPPRVPAPHASSTAGGTKVSPYLMIAFVFHFAFAGLQVTNAFYVQDTLKIDTASAIQRVSLISLAFAASSFAVQAFVVRLLGWPPRRLLTTGFAVCAVASVGTLMADDLAGLLVAFGSMGAGFAAAQSGLTAGASLAGGDGRQGQVAGRLQAAMSAAWIVGPLAGAALYEVAMEGPLLVTVAAMGVGLLALPALIAPRAA